MKTAHDLVALAKAKIQEVTVDQATPVLKGADFLLDVREPDEYAAGHLPGAISIPRGVLEFILSSHAAFAARDLNMVVYCKTSGRAALAACAMLDMGYRQVISISGGFDAWQAAGLPIEQPVHPAFE
ncbi:MAG: sulfurtransferase [Pseudomonadales bacterium]|nr:sulfurtransferase [Pseudomonadales bacterium]